MATCIACLLDLPVWQIPDMHGGFPDDARRYLRSLNYEYLEINVKDYLDKSIFHALPNTYCILSGTTIRYDICEHAIIGKIDGDKGDIYNIWDPHPSNGFLETINSIGFIISLPNTVIRHHALKLTHMVPEGDQFRSRTEESK